MHFGEGIVSFTAQRKAASAENAVKRYDTSKGMVNGL
jgi:hypothetical protein